MAARVGGRAHLGGVERPGRAAQGIRARDAALPVGRAAHRPPEDLFGGRRRGALQAPHRPPGAPPDGLRRLRAPGREPRDQDRPAPARVHGAVDHAVPRAVPRMGHLDRLDARVRHAPARVLPLDPVDLPAPVRARAGLPQGGSGQVVSPRPDRAGQRAGDRRPLRALRPRGRGAPARAVVLPHHRLRRPPARRHARDRLAAQRGDHAGELDRPLGGRRGDVPVRGAGHRLPGVHHPARHALRRHLLRPGAGAPRRAAAA